jgi:hypothetical protein
MRGCAQSLVVGPSELYDGRDMALVVTQEANSVEKWCQCFEHGHARTIFNSFPELFLEVVSKYSVVIAHMHDLLLIEILSDSHLQGPCRIASKCTHGDREPLQTSTDHR